VGMCSAIFTCLVSTMGGAATGTVHGGVSAWTARVRATAHAPRGGVRLLRRIQMRYSKDAPGHRSLAGYRYHKRSCPGRDRRLRCRVMDGGARECCLDGTLPNCFTKWIVKLDAGGGLPVDFYVRFFCRTHPPASIFFHILFPETVGPQSFSLQERNDCFQVACRLLDSADLRTIGQQDHMQIFFQLAYLFQVFFA